MTMDGEVLTLTHSDIVKLSQVIATKHMEVIALVYFGFDFETIKNIKHDCRGNPLRFNSHILSRWRNKNAGPGQVEVSCLYVTFITIECKKRGNADSQWGIKDFPWGGGGGWTANVGAFR